MTPELCLTILSNEKKNFFLSESIHSSSFEVFTFSGIIFFFNKKISVYFSKNTKKNLKKKSFSNKKFKNI